MDTARPRVVAIIPAHNEQESIEATVLSVLKQDYPSLEAILVMADNCTDATVALVERVSASFPRVRCVPTINNQYKKAGALNQGFDIAVSLQADIILQLDADTLIESDVVSKGVEYLGRDPELGGLCARYGLAIKTRQPIGQRILWWLQNIEYGLYDSERVASSGAVRVLSGTASMLRVEALQQVKKGGQVWSHDSIVEDYTLTLDIKQAGWKTSVGMEMRSWTDSMESVPALWRQRQRWYKGTIAEMVKRAKEPVVRPDLVNLLVIFLLIFARVFVLVALTYVLASGLWHWTWLSFAMPALVLSYYLQQMKGVQNRDVYQWVIVLTIIPYELYSILREIMWVAALYKVAVKTEEAW